MEITRRSFLKRAAISGVAAVTIATGTSKVAAKVSPDKKYATVIDLTKCTGCNKCVLACREKNKNKYPNPEDEIMDYWPQKIHEDWTDKKDITNRLTPYNWLYVQSITVNHKGENINVNIPRRCMHCDNPPCAALCPFGVNNKTSQGAVVIDTDICFGGAKCRDVCPWHIPQRQAGVGLYKEIAPKFAGGGVMYKCDFCQDLLEKGQKPACVSACPNKAITLGEKEDMLRYAINRASELEGYIYGDTENGGTSTYYVSKVPFEKIDQAIKEQEVDGKLGRPDMPVNINNSLETVEGMAKGIFLAPLAGIVAASLNIYKIMKGDSKNENTEA